MQQHKIFPFQALLKIPLKIYFWIAVVSTIIGLGLDFREASLDGDGFIFTINLICLILSIISLIIFSINEKKFITASAIFILSVILTIVLSDIYLQIIGNPIWQYYFLRDTGVFIILLTFTGFFLSKIYVYSLASIYCITTIILWQLAPDSFVGRNVFILVFLISNYSIGISLFSHKLKVSFKEKEELNILISKKEREILQMENQKISDKLTHVNETLKLKNQELVCRAMFLAEQMEKNTHSAKKLENLESFVKDEKRHELKKVIHILQSEDSSHWNEFQVRFNDVYQDFYSNLKIDFPDLSQGEMKLSAFMKLKLSSKEIAILTHTTKAGIDVSRSRLRKKLQLNTGDSLHDFLEKY